VHGAEATDGLGRERVHGVTCGDVGLDGDRVRAAGAQARGDGFCGIELQIGEHEARPTCRERFRQRRADTTAAASMNPNTRASGGSGITVMNSENSAGMVANIRRSPY